ncbi:MAG: radical SAM protein [Candidatus Omnitrophica bacterium]|nr:radical SAM protein [Candidatus Omnitrophota bacterium]
MKYIYGPVQSRRLGLSLGISLTPYKICTFDCVYCQLGVTTLKTQEIKEYIRAQDILEELRIWLQLNNQDSKNLSYITLSGAGEPTLNSQIGTLIVHIKSLTSTPVAVITNASLLASDVVRQRVLSADIIVPSLDAVTSRIFAKIDRPLPEIKIEEIIEGLIKLRSEFPGKIWLEIMLVKGMNDDVRHIRKLREVIERIDPEKIHLNSPVRTTAEPNVLAVDRKKLEKIQEILGEKTQII